MSPTRCQHLHNRAVLVITPPSAVSVVSAASAVTVAPVAALASSAPRAWVSATPRVAAVRVAAAAAVDSALSAKLNLAIGSRTRPGLIAAPLLREAPPQTTLNPPQMNRFMHAVDG